MMYQYSLKARQIISNKFGLGYGPAGAAHLTFSQSSDSVTCLAEKFDNSKQDIHKTFR